MQRNAANRSTPPPLFLSRRYLPFYPPFYVGKKIYGESPNFFHFIYEFFDQFKDRSFYNRDLIKNIFDAT